MQIENQETQGELFVLGEAILYGFFPLVVNHAVKFVSPLLFAGLSSLVAAVALFIYLFSTKTFHHLFNKKALIYILGVTLFIIVLPSIFIFIGTSFTSGVNTTILLQAEVFFTFLFCGLFFGEKITSKKLIGALAIVIGTTIVIFNGSLVINWGDILILSGVAFYPFGNMCAKKALSMVPSTAILFIRSFLGGLILILLSFIFESSFSVLGSTIFNFYLFILINGLAVMFLSKIFWYEGLKRIDISKAITIGMSYPAFSLIFLFLFVQEIPNLYQLIGLFVTMAGVVFITYKKKKNIPVPQP